METIAERAEAILDKIAQRRLNPCPLEAITDNDRDDELVEGQEHVGNAATLHRIEEERLAGRIDVDRD